MKLRLKGNSFLCDENKVFYINIPKCASTTIRHMFFKNVDYQQYHNELNSRYIKFVNYFNKDEFFKFTFVRNPFDRMASNYLFFTQRESRQRYMVKNLGQEYLKNGISFRDFILFTNHKNNGHWDPQQSRVIHQQVSLDFVGKIENFAEDCKIVEQNFREGAYETDTHRNPNTNEVVYKDYYTNETIELVKQKYKIDFEAFNYSDEL